MHEYRDGELAGVTIVDYGLSLNVLRGVATVHYDGAQGNYFDVVSDGRLFNGLMPVQIDQEQLRWLKDQGSWVERRIADDRE